MQKISRKIENSTAGKIVANEDFNLKLGTCDYVLDITHHATFGSYRFIRGFPTNRWNITLLWLLCCPVVFSSSRAQLEPLRRFLRWMVQFLSNNVIPPKDGLFGGHDDGWRHMEKYATKTPQKGAWTAVSTKTSQSIHRNIFGNINRRTSDSGTNFRPRKALRGWSGITPKQIQHGWRSPSWKSIWRHISAVGGPIWTKFGSPMQNNTPTTVKWSWWNRK